MSAHLCLASSMIIGDKPLPVRFFYRESPSHVNDSGFRFYSGLESDEYLSQQQSACVTPLDLMSRLQPDIKPLIERTEVGSVWEFCMLRHCWRPVDDYQIPRD